VTIVPAAEPSTPQSGGSGPARTAPTVPPAGGGGPAGLPPLSRGEVGRPREAGDRTADREEGRRETPLPGGPGRKSG
jgi:hypothetical protein